MQESISESYKEMEKTCENIVRFCKGNGQQMKIILYRTDTASIFHYVLAKAIALHSISNTSNDLFYTKTTFSTQDKNINLDIDLRNY